MNAQVDAYIKQARASGQTDEQIKKALLQSGWKQEQVNDAFGIPNPQSGVTPPPPPPAQGQTAQSFDPEALTKNPKFMTTVKTFAIYIPILMVVNFVVAIITSGLKYGFYEGIFGVAALIMAIIYGVISGAISGVVFYFIYNPVRDFVKRTPFLAKYIHNMFTLMWVPSLVGSVIGGVFGLLGLLSLGAMTVGVLGSYGIASMSGAFFGVIISFVVNIVIYYFYAKTISKKLEPLYPW